jgi:hypothetical protein
MKPVISVFAMLAVLFLVLSPIVAGCLSVPGPESGKKTPAVTAAVTISPTALATPVKTPVTPSVTHSPVGTSSPAVTSVPAVTTIESGYESTTCTQQGGTVVTPGQQCTGTWLAATDTFSCCSAKPVMEAGGNEENLTVLPLNLTVNINDSLGSIGP